MRKYSFSVFFSWSALWFLFQTSCDRSESKPPSQYPTQPQPTQQTYPPNYYPPQPYPTNGSYYPPNYYPQPQPTSGQQPPPNYFPPLPTWPTYPTVNPLADPINNIDIGWLRNQSNTVIQALIVALPVQNQSKVRGIPLVPDPTIGEVNAFAACDNQGKALMAISDGLLEIQANIAQFKATDEIFGSRKLDSYLQFIAQNQRQSQPIVKPPAGMIDPSQHVDVRKVTRQHQILDEQISFVLGHELGHHYLGHTGCANGQGVSSGASSGDLARALSQAVPIFNQPNEIAADISGVNNLLSAGAKQQGYKWSENGALLTLQFFSTLDQLTPASVIFAFESTHPHPLVRIPIVQQTSNTWRMTGGTGFQIPGLEGLFP